MCYSIRAMATTVSVLKCSRYELPELRQAVRRALELLPEAGGLLQGGKTVLLKVNLVTPRPAEKAVCTHPALLRVVAELAAEAGCKIVIADQPTYNLTGQAAHIFGQAGYVEALKGIDVEFALLSLAGFSRVEVPRHHHWQFIQSANLLREADLVINLPKAKTHVQTVYTGAV